MRLLEITTITTIVAVLSGAFNEGIIFFSEWTGLDLTGVSGYIGYSLIAICAISTYKKNKVLLDRKRNELEESEKDKL